MAKVARAGTVIPTKKASTPEHTPDTTAPEVADETVEHEVDSESDLEALIKESRKVSETIERLANSQDPPPEETMMMLRDSLAVVQKLILETVTKLGGLDRG